MSMYLHMKENKAEPIEDSLSNSKHHHYETSLMRQVQPDSWLRRGKLKRLQVSILESTELGQES